jgi:hypothetical protein
MSAMFDIAGGIIIAAVVLGTLYLGLILAIPNERHFLDDSARAFGILLALAAAVFSFWLIFLRTGAIPLQLPR